MIDLRYSLAVLATRMPWAWIEATLAPIFARRTRDGQSVAGEDLFGTTLVVAGVGVSAAGRPRLPIRLMVGLLYLKHAYNESVSKRWTENNYWQYFCGETYFQPCLPCDMINLVRFRVPEKAIAYPVDSRLLGVARTKLARLVQRADLVLSQTYEREGKRRRRLLRDVERKLSGTSQAQQTALRLWVERVWQICRQLPKDKNKLYALYAPKVESIGKSKARQPYEFEIKVSLVLTHKQGLIVGAQFPGNPYDGHTLYVQLEQIDILLEAPPGPPRSKTAVVDLGFRGVDVEVTPVEIIQMSDWRLANDAGCCVPSCVSPADCVFLCLHTCSLLLGASANRPTRAHNALTRSFRSYGSFDLCLLPPGKTNSADLAAN